MKHSNVKDNNNKVLACDILRLEHLNEEVPTYLNGIDTMPRARNVQVLKLITKNCIIPKLIQDIADWYKEDIEYWNFDFDTSARSNYTCK